MSYALSAVKDKPSALWLLGDASPFQEYSGSLKVGDMSVGTPAPAAALISETSFSSVFSSTAIGRFSVNEFRQGREAKTFTLEAWVYEIISTTTGEQQVLSHSGQYDGITINGNTVSFVTKYLTAPEARASYQLQSNRKVHAVGVHTSDKNILYVNGQLVDEVELTDVQKADQFVATDGFLYSGNTTSAQKIAMAGVATYSTALSPEAVYAHYVAGNRSLVDTQVTNMYGGSPMEMNVKAGNSFTEVVWEKELLKTGSFINTVVDNDRLHPILSNSVSVAGTWTTAFALDTSAVTSIYGVSLDWTGQGAVVDVSLDGLTWETVSKRTLVATITNGFDPTDKELLVRVSFPGGITDDESYIERISVIGWQSNVVPVFANRTVMLTHPAVLRGDGAVFDYRDDVGLYLDGGSVSIGADISPDPLNPLTIELWVRINSGTLTVNQTGTTYVNGAASSTIDVGEWTLYHIVTAAPVTTAITITGDVSIAHVGLYDDALTAQQISDVYDAFTGLTAVSITESSTLSVTGAIDPVKIYTHDWAITSAG